MNYSLNSLYRAAGVSKQGYSQYQKRYAQFLINLDILISEVDDIRSEHPGCGLEKMYYTINPYFIGRDKFIEIFMEWGYRVIKNKNYIRTTYSVASKYENLIKGLEINGKNQIWQSDITYYPVGKRFYYIVFILDVYTKTIVGYKVSDNLRAEANIDALRMALGKLGEHTGGLIHHSDRGSQYIDQKYVGLLNKYLIQISMADSSQENAYVERVNGIIKNEYLKYRQIENYEELKMQLRRAVKHYNTKRIHRSLPDWMTPAEFEKEIEIMDAKYRPILNIYNYNSLNYRT